jgi:hypothetical protein
LRAQRNEARQSFLHVRVTSPTQKEKLPRFISLRSQ